MKYAIRHQAAGILPERYNEQPSDALLRETRDMLAAHFGETHPKTGLPWWQKVIEAPDEADLPESHLHARCIEMAARAATALSQQEGAHYRWRRAAIALLLALLGSLAGNGYQLAAHECAPTEAR